MKMVPDAMRDEVLEFALGISAALDAESLDRYMSPAYRVKDALDRLADEAAQLAYDAQTALNADRAIKGAAIIAGLCMAIAVKVKAGHQV